MATSLGLRRDGRDDRDSAGSPVNVIAFFMFAVPAFAGVLVALLGENPYWAVAGVVVGYVLGQAPKVAAQWERAVLFRLGRYAGLRGPGLFWIVPFIETIPSWIDQRVVTTGFAAEQTLTADTVPVNVDAVLFWLVHDPEKAALEVQSYRNAVSWAAQTALRDIIGRTSLSDLLRGREQIEEELQRIIDARTSPWGATVQSVDMRDIVIPASLQDAMSREAQATREKSARVILSQAEVEIAKSFETAALSYQNNPVALQLRAMNMLYEGLKERGGLMVVPSSAVESLGGMMGAAALAQQRPSGPDAAPSPRDRT